MTFLQMENFVLVMIVTIPWGLILKWQKIKIQKNFFLKITMSVSRTECALMAYASTWTERLRVNVTKASFYHPRDIHASVGVSLFFSILTINFNFILNKIVGKITFQILMNVTKIREYVLMADVKTYQDLIGASAFLVSPYLKTEHFV